MVSVTTVDEGAVCTAMLDLYQNEGIIAEPAGALSVAGLLEADLTPGSTVVCLISGGNNDVSRYGEVLERSLVHKGLKHYFLVDFPRARCAAPIPRRDSGPTTTSRSSSTSSATTGETGEALVGIELGSAADLDGLHARMNASGLHVEALEPGSPAYRYLTWTALSTATGGPAMWWMRRRPAVHPSPAVVGRWPGPRPDRPQVAGDRDPAAAHHDPAPPLVELDVEVGQPRIGHIGFGASQSDQAAIELQEPGVVRLTDLRPVQLGAQKRPGSCGSGTSSASQPWSANSDLRPSAVAAANSGSGWELKNWNGRVEPTPRP